MRIKKFLVRILIILVGGLFSVACQPNVIATATSTLLSVESPTVMSPTTTPELAPTVIPSITISSKTPTLAPCSWIGYFDDGTTVSMGDSGNCLGDVRGISISKDERRISFFTHLSTDLGTYSVCKDIAKIDDLKFTVAVTDNMASSRFLIMIGPNPIPTNKLSLGLRIQPENLKNGKEEIWVKFIEYVSNNSEVGYGDMQAIPDWKSNHTWNFDFIFSFNGPKIALSMNKRALSRAWQLNSINRYLCFAYQQTPTASLSSELEVQVKFP